MNKFLFVALLCSAYGFVAAQYCTDSNRDCMAWAERGECFNSPSYMSVYCCSSCEQHSAGNTETACPDLGESIELFCPGSQVIKIQQAFYGRINTHTCGAVAGASWCSSSTASRVAKQRCEGKRSCSLSASSGLYGDPCPGVGKYLTVSWDCVGGATPTRTAPNSFLTYLLYTMLSKGDAPIPIVSTKCENAVMNLACGDGKTVAIKSAFYGREAKDETTCNADSKDFSVHVECRDAGSALTEAVAVCTDKQSCTLKVLQSKLGEPKWPKSCLTGDVAYLKVTYLCEDKTL